MTSVNTSRPVLYFDGVCNLCNGVVQFIIRHDKKQQFLFASLQSVSGQKILAEMPEAAQQAGSVILQYNNKYYTRSSAILQVCRLLGGWFMLLLAGYILPPFIRNTLYNFIARNRYRWFGQKEECMIPTPELKNRFIE